MVNDNLGHEKGDELLQKASNFICLTFSHSPVFRIGGDEFVAIVDGNDYDTIDEKMQDFQAHMQNIGDKNDILEVCIASGIAKMGVDGNIYDELLEIADKRMYQNKADIKKGKKSR